MIKNSNQSQNSISCDVSDLTEIKEDVTSKHLGWQNDSNPGTTLINNYPQLGSVQVLYKQVLPNSGPPPK